MTLQSQPYLPLSIPTRPDPAATHGNGLLTVDLDAIAANYRLLVRTAGGTKSAAVLKADAYGLGAARVGPVLAAAGCRHFFTAHLDEAMALRPHLPAGCAVFVLHGLPPGGEADMAAHRLIPVLNSLAQIDAWTALARRTSTPLPAAVQVDTGMSRLGLDPDELAVLADDPARLSGLDLRLVMSHLSWAEQADHPANQQALARFQAARRLLPLAPASLASSAGIFLGEAFHFDLLRPGAALYGLAPRPDAPNPMQPVVRLQGQVIQIREISAGTAVGYNGRYVAPGARRVATVGVGYADGFLRCLGNRAIAAVAGVAVPVVGAVSMDLITLDVTDVPGTVAPGTLVDLIGGAAASPEALAAAAGTIPYEILTSLGSRYHRSYLGGGAIAAVPATHRTGDLP